MKKILTTVFLMALSISAFSQAWSNDGIGVTPKADRATNSYIKRIRVVETDSTIYFYDKNGKLLNPQFNSGGVLKIGNDTAATKAYARTYGGSGTVVIEDVQDEIADSLNVLRPLYVRTADTSDMLSPYLLSGDIVGKVNVSDTANMLSPYINRVDTTSMLTPYINRADTAAMLSSYLNTSSGTGSLYDYAVKKYADTVALSAGRTLLLTDDAKRIYCTFTARDTIFIPTNANVAFQKETTIYFGMEGTGAIFFSPLVGVTIYAPLDSVNLNTRRDMAALIYRGNDNWKLIGTKE